MFVPCFAAIHICVYVHIHKHSHNMVLNTVTSELQTDEGETDQLLTASLCLFRADFKEPRVGTRRVSSGRQFHRVGAQSLKVCLLVPGGGEETHVQRPQVPPKGWFMEEV